MPIIQFDSATERISRATNFGNGGTMDAAELPGLRRDQILTPGGYVSITKDMMADPNVTPGAKLVMACLLDHLGKNNRGCWPGPATIGRETSLTRRGVQQAIAQLIKVGWVAIVGRSQMIDQAAERANATNVYVI